ncbi:hypothetical protein QR510_30845, partial [Escherichia coli]
VLCSDDATAQWRGYFHGAIQQQGDHGHFRCRIGVANASAKRAPVPNGKMGDVLHSLVNNRTMCFDQFVGCRHAMTNERT